MEKYEKRMRELEEKSAVQVSLAEKKRYFSERFHFLDFSFNKKNLLNRIMIIFCETRKKARNLKN